MGSVWVVLKKYGIGKRYTFSYNVYKRFGEEQNYI
jgi:hypothetical protein